MHDVLREWLGKRPVSHNMLKKLLAWADMDILDMSGRHTTMHALFFAMRTLRVLRDQIHGVAGLHKVLEVYDIPMIAGA